MSTLQVTNLKNASTADGGISIDTSGHVTVDNVAMPSSGPLSNRNKIINGDMRIDQRNAGASVTPANGATTYTVDRFSFFVNQASKLTAQQSTVAPTGFSNSLKVTSSSAYSVGATDVFNLQQAIEGFNVADLGWGAAGAKSITLSFWVYSSLTGTFGGSLLNSAQNRSYPFTYSISAANTWEQKVVTIAGDTSGTWLTNNGVGLTVGFSMGSGSTYNGTAGAWSGSTYYSATGATSVVGTNGATFYITGVQLEAGTVATPFEHRSYGDELLRCQRYYYRVNASSLYTAYGFGWNNSTSGGQAIVKHPVRMRDIPSSMDHSLLASTVLGVSDALITSATLGTSASGTDTSTVIINSSGAFTPGFMTLTAKNSASSYLGFSAEL